MKFWTLLADERLREISDQIRDSVRNDQFAIVMLIVLLLLIIVWGIYRQFRPVIQRRKEIDSLFNQLCSVHDLTESQKRLLRNIASRKNIDNPCRIFVHPALLLSELHQGKEVEVLARKIYGSEISKKIRQKT